MLDFIKGLFSGESGLALQVVSIIVAVNIALTGLKAAVDSIKDQTENSIDNTISNVLSKVLGVLGWIVDVVSANKEHKKDS